MFNKTSKPTPRDDKPQAVVTPPLDVPGVNLTKKTGMAAMGGSTKAFSSMGSGLIIEGNVAGTGDLHLDGTVRGDVKVSHLTVGESGSVEGKVEADTVEVRGRIIGSITGKQIKLQATAYVEGDITHEQLAIDVGAYFHGRCLQTRRAEPTPSISTIGEHVSADGHSPAMASYDMSALSDLK